MAKKSEKNKKDSDSLVQTLDAAEEAAGARKTKVGDVVESLDARGFGPLLMLPAIVTILPTGAIPGVPDICAVLLTLVAVQILFGRTKPWLPEKLKKFGVATKKFTSAIDKARPWMKKIDKVTRQRWTFFTGKTAQRVIALVIIGICALSIVVGMIPYVPALLMLPVLFFAVGLTTHDGVVVAIGLFVLACAGIIISQIA